MFRVLAMDGGGIRGVIPAAVLTHIESLTGTHPADLFDLVVGTSTGGIIAAGIAAPKDGGSPKFSAADMLNLYVERGHEIFDRSFWRGITTLGGFGDEQYDHRPLERILKKYLGDTTLADCLVPIVVTSYDIERREPYFFKTVRAQDSKDRNHYLRDVARATSAAPTYFEPAVVKSMARNPTRRVLVDGGVFVNNPALCGWIEAQTMADDPADVLVVSLGTGIATRKIPYEDAKGWGAAGWVRPIISVMMDGASDAADFHLRQVLPDKEQPERQRYFRFDTELELALDDMDAANRGNIRNLQQEAAQIIEDQAEELERLAALLTGAASAAPSV